MPSYPLAPTHMTHHSLAFMKWCGMAGRWRSNSSNTTTTTVMSLCIVYRLRWPAPNIGLVAISLGFSFYIDDCQWYSKYLLEDKAFVRTILKHSNLAILDVDCVRLIHGPQEPHLTLSSDINPLKWTVVIINILSSITNELRLKSLE